MVGTSRALKLVLFSQLLLGASAGGPSRPPNFISVCKEIEYSISNASDVFYPLEASYTSDISHWATSSTQNSTCSVEPGSAEDVGKIIRIIGKHKIPFAVKGGGHTANQGFSSTVGVQIAMTRFSDVIYNADTSTAEVGAGLIWDNVYEALEPYNVSVVGGRVSGVGVAGFTLGGGYSWKTNQYGLTIDTIQAFELVLPNGTVTTVNSDNEDLFFALKGGYNNFGIVTKFTFKAVPQTQVWGGLIIYSATTESESLSAATSNFSINNTDPKAAMLVEFTNVANVPLVTVQIFYDSPEQPAGIFDEFLAIPALSKDVSTRSYLSFVQSTPANATAGMRAAFHTVNIVNYTPSLMSVILQEYNSVSLNLTSLFSTGTFIGYNVEPFVPSFLDKGSPSAYPPSRAISFSPFNLYFGWLSPTADDHFTDAIKRTAKVLEDAAVAEGQDVGGTVLYGNYAIDGTSLDRIFGDNLPRLQRIKAQYDPENVMALAGGWKIAPYH